MPVADYCSAVWNRCGKGNTDLIEKLQRGAARIIMNSPTSDEALEKLRYDTLESRGEKYILKLVRKCLTGQVPQCFNDYFTFNRNVVKRVTRQSGFTCQEFAEN